MDVITSFPSDAQAAEAVQPGDRALDDVAEGTEASAVGFAPSCDHGPEAALPELAAVDVVVVAAVGQQSVRASAGSADPARDGRDLVEQGQQLGDVVAVAAGQRDRERDALAVDDEVVLAAWPGAVDRAGPALDPCGQPTRARSRSPPAPSPVGSWPAASPAAARAAGPTRRPRSRPPDAASTSCPSRSPAPGAGTPTGCRYAARTGSRAKPAGPALAVSALHLLRPRLRQQRLDQRPQFIRHDPRPRLTVSHTQTYGQNRQPTHDQQLLSGPVRANA